MADLTDTIDFALRGGPINYAYPAEMSPKSCSMKTCAAKLRTGCLRGFRISEGRAVYDMFI